MAPSKRPPAPSDAPVVRPPLSRRAAAQQADLVQGQRSDWQYLVALMPYLVRQKGSVLTAAVLYPLTALCAALPPFLMEQMFDRGIASGKGDLLFMLAGAYLTSLVLEFGLGFASEYLVSRLGQQAMAAIRADLFAHLQRLPISYFSRVPVGRLVTRVTSDVEALGEIFTTGAISVISDLLSVIAVLGMMLWLSPSLTFAACLLVPLLLVVASAAQRFSRRAFQEIRRHLARINAFLAEHVATMDVVQVYGQQARTEAEFWQLNEAYRDSNHRAIVVDATLYAMVEAIGTAAVAVTVAWGASDLAAGGIKAGVLVAFIQYIRRFFVPIRDLSTKYTVLQGAFAAAERIFSLLHEPVVLQSPPDARPVPTFADKIELRDVWFRFDEPDESDEMSEADAAKALAPSGKGVRAPDRFSPVAQGEARGGLASEASKASDSGGASQSGNWVLQEMSLTIRKGERVGLVGATGSGKTTLLGLLNRSFDVQRGQVVLDGVDVKAMRLDELRRLFAVVLQDATLFRGSVLENMQVADRLSLAAVKSALTLVQADAIVDALPKGLDTDVGARGDQLSAGERQVLSLARAVALQAPILLMDEATSHVDTPTEARIQKGIDVMLEGRTAIIVAHRLSTIRRVDRVVVLSRGKVVQQGPPDELARLPGPYRELLEKNDERLPQGG